MIYGSGLRSQPMPRRRTSSRPSAAGISWWRYASTLRLLAFCMRCIEGALQWPRETHLERTSQPVHQETSIAGCDGRSDQPRGLDQFLRRIRFRPIRLWRQKQGSASRKLHSLALREFLVQLNSAVAYSRPSEKSCRTLDRSSDHFGVENACGIDAASLTA